jgi:GrpB-like predicted nucleotidyltransferase (UPF0157 family)
MSEISPVPLMNWADVAAKAEATFQQLKRELGELLPTSAEIEHIGATSVPGCITKGDLDLVIRVDPDDFMLAEQMLAQRLARNTGSVRTDAFASFECEDLDPLTGIQLVSKGSPLDSFLAFRDLLLSNPLLVQSYNDLKRGACQLGRDGYWEAKDAFINRVLQEHGYAPDGQGG